MIDTLILSSVLCSSVVAAITGLCFIAAYVAHTLSFTMMTRILTVAGLVFWLHFMVC